LKAQKQNSSLRRAAIAVSWLGPYSHTAEFLNEGVGVRVLRKTEPRVLHDFEHTASSIGRLIVPTGVAEFAHCMNAIGSENLDRDLVGKIAINLPLRDLTFASDHHRQKVSESKTRKWTADPRPHCQRDEASHESRWLCASISGRPASQRGTPQKGLDGGKSLVSAAEDGI
jgi:hypothetical protein